MIPSGLNVLLHMVTEYCDRHKALRQTKSRSLILSRLCLHVKVIHSAGAAIMSTGMISFRCEGLKLLLRLQGLCFFEEASNQ